MTRNDSRYTEPRLETSALIVIDMQRDFLDDAACPIPGTDAVVPRIVNLLTAFRDARRPIVHVVRIYREDGRNVDLCRRALVEGGAKVVRPGDDGVEIASPLTRVRLDTDRLIAGELQPAGDREWIMYKPRWGAFFQTPLDAHLRSLGVSTVVVAGCNFPNCPRTSIYEASERDYRAAIVTDAVSGIYERGLTELRNIGVATLTTDEVCANLATTSNSPGRLTGRF